jgi:hypothetical protein
MNRLTVYGWIFVCCLLVIALAMIISFTGTFGTIALQIDPASDPGVVPIVPTPSTETEPSMLQESFPLYSAWNRQFSKISSVTSHGETPSTAATAVPDKVQWVPAEEMSDTESAKLEQMLEPWRKQLKNVHAPEVRGRLLTEFQTQFLNWSVPKCLPADTKPFSKPLISRVIDASTRHIVNEWSNLVHTYARDLSRPNSRRNLVLTQWLTKVQEWFQNVNLDAEMGWKVEQIAKLKTELMTGTSVIQDFAWIEASTSEWFPEAADELIHDWHSLKSQLVRYNLVYVT